MDNKFREPNVESPHRKFWQHIRNGGFVFRNDRLNNVREWLNVEMIGGDPNAIVGYGFDDLIIPPHDASDYTDDGFSVTFYRRSTAFGMNMLDYWKGDTWHVAGTLPWDLLQPVPGYSAALNEKYAEHDDESSLDM